MRKLKYLAALLLLICLLPLCGCAVYDMLGIDTHAYGEEPRIATLNTDGAVASELQSMIPMMIQNTPYLAPFDTPAEAAELYRDGILCFVLDKNYSKYNANTELIAATRELYPAYEITTVIPVVDFESTVYRYFGGTVSVENRSTKLFTYLDKVDAYVSVGIGVDRGAAITITELYETENTYVCTFTSAMHDSTAGPYRLLLMKREDGTFYMKSLVAVE